LEKSLPTTNPSISFRLCLTFFSIVTAVAAVVLSSAQMKLYCYLFGVFWGISLGWFYPTEDLMLSMICPVGQEAELSGFFVFSSNILVWLPPLIFTAMNESGISMQWGLMSLVIFFAFGIGLLSFMDKWENIRSERDNGKDSVDVEIVAASE